MRYGDLTAEIAADPVQLAALNARLVQEGEQAIANSVRRAGRRNQQSIYGLNLGIEDKEEDRIGGAIQAAGLQGMLGNILYGRDLSDKEENRIVQNFGNLIIGTRDRLQAGGATNVSQEMINASITAEIDIQKRYNIAGGTSPEAEQAYVEIIQKMATVGATSASEFLGADARKGAAGYDAMSQKVFESDYGSLGNARAIAI